MNEFCLLGEEKPIKAHYPMILKRVTLIFHLSEVMTTYLQADNLMCIEFCVPIAQLVKHCVRKAKLMGSIPTRITRTDEM